MSGEQNLTILKKFEKFEDRVFNLTIFAMKMSQIRSSLKYAYLYTLKIKFGNKHQNFKMLKFFVSSMSAIQFFIYQNVCYNLR